MPGKMCSATDSVLGTVTYQTMGKECNQVFVGRRRNMTPLKTTAWEAKAVATFFFCFWSCTYLTSVNRI